MSFLDGDKLQHIKEKLSHKYDDSEPDISNFWVAGDMCIAKYHGDNSWYRGTILKVGDHCPWILLVPLLHITKWNFVAGQ